jgi:signal transduction histidine kinase
LATITAEGQLDTARLDAIVGDVITRARTTSRDERRPVALFGEMVSLLCARGEPQVALELEQHWNGLIQEIPMKLFCGYAAGSFDRAAHAEVFQKICAEHTHVLPEESYLELENEGDRLRYVAEAQQKARALESELAARRQSEDALIRSEKLAVMGRLTASIAHEINNPLASLTNLFYLINTDTSLDPAARHYAELADQELRRTARITKQMLGFYRESTKPVPCLLAPIMDGVLELYQPRLRACSIIVEKEYTTDGAVSGFPAEMRQLFANLIGNAIEAVGKAGRIRLRIASGRDWADPVRLGVRVSVADTGAGMAAEDRKHIFEPFFTTKGESGTGLGLWVSRGIVQKHEGRIRFRSRVHSGQPSGTIFSVFLPAAQKPSDVQEIPAAAQDLDALRAAG